MSMRIIVYGLLALLVLIQYPLWLGKGGWLYVYELDKQVKAQEEKNRQLQLRNAKLEGDVKDLKDGTRAIEERARIEHGMVKDNEILVQILQGESSTNSSAAKPNVSGSNPSESPAPTADSRAKAAQRSDSDSAKSTGSVSNSAKKAEKIAQ